METHCSNMGKISNDANSESIYDCHVDNEAQTNQR